MITITNYDYYVKVDQGNVKLSAPKNRTSLDFHIKRGITITVDGHNFTISNAGDVAAISDESRTGSGAVAVPSDLNGIFDTISPFFFLESLADYGLEIARGNITGQYPVDKFGRAPDVDTGAADLWGYSATQKVWLAPTAARSHNLVSTDANDAAAGTGLRTCQVYGLQTWASKESSEVVTLNGLSNVALANDYVMIHRIKPLTWGSAGPNVGIITVTAATDNTVTAMVLAGSGQTEMAIFGIPSNQTFYLKSIYLSILKATNADADITLLYNSTPDQETTGFITKMTFGVPQGGNDPAYLMFDPPRKFEGPGILKLQAIASTVNCDLSGGFDGVLIDN